MRATLKSRGRTKFGFMPCEPAGSYIHRCKMGQGCGERSPDGNCRTIPRSPIGCPTDVARLEYGPARAGNSGTGSEQQRAGLWRLAMLFVDESKTMIAKWWIEQYADECEARGETIAAIKIRQMLDHYLSPQWTVEYATDAPPKANSTIHGPPNT